MKGIIITTENKVEIKDFDEPLYKSVGAAVGGHIELVHPIGLADPYVMIVNEEGLIYELPLNVLGCVLYGTHNHGQPIVGDIVVMKTGWTDDGPDIVGLEDQECAELAATFDACFKEA